MGLLDALINGPASSIGRQTRQADLDQEKQLTKQRAQKFDMDFFDHMIDQGALPVQSGMVKRPMYNPGNPNLGTAPLGDIPAFDPSNPNAGGMTAMPAGVGPTNGVLLDKADPSRLINHTTAEGDTVQFELPTEEAQRNKALWRTIADYMNPAVRQARQAQNQNTLEATQAATQGAAQGRDAADVQKREAEGIPIPASLENQLPGISTAPNGQPRKVLPSELDDIIKATGSYADLTARAGTRGQPKPKSVMKSEIKVDPQGNQTVVNTNTDGTVDEIPLKAKGVVPREPGSLTPYEQWQMGRGNNNDAVQRVKEWQDKVDKLQSQSESLWSQKESADNEVAALTEQMNAKTPGILGSGVGSGPALKGAERFKIQSRINDLKRKSDGAGAQAARIDSQKRTADTVRRSIMSANGFDDGGRITVRPGASGASVAAPAANGSAAPQNAAPKVATRDQVHAYAQRFGMDDASALKAFQDDGITVK